MYRDTCVWHLAWVIVDSVVALTIDPENIWQFFGMLHPPIIISSRIYLY